MYKQFGKRLLDIAVSVFVLVVLSPILLITAILVRIQLGTPILFIQQRPGLHERLFKLYKFRSMTDKKDDQNRLLPDGCRLTRFGRWLRSTSLDELPEFWNILKGDMSIVGPRPLLVRDLVFMTSTQRQRHTVLPGLTGLSQVNGRNRIPWEEKLEYDLKYIENITFLGDCKIILKTFFQVLKRDGITEEGHDTAEDLGDYLLRQKKISEEDFHKKMESTNQIYSKG